MEGINVTAILKWFIPMMIKYEDIFKLSEGLNGN